MYGIGFLVEHFFSTGLRRFNKFEIIMIATETSIQFCAFHFKIKVMSVLNK
jgi:hypothetical protein